MIALGALTIVTSLFAISGLGLFVATIYRVLAQRDELYRAKYEEFMAHRYRVIKKLQKGNGPK